MLTEARRSAWIVSIPWLSAQKGSTTIAWVLGPYGGRSHASALRLTHFILNRPAPALRRMRRTVRAAAALAMTSSVWWVMSSSRNSAVPLCVGYLVRIRRVSSTSVRYRTWSRARLRPFVQVAVSGRRKRRFHVRGCWKSRTVALCSPAYIDVEPVYTACIAAWPSGRLWGQ